MAKIHAAPRLWLRILLWVLGLLLAAALLYVAYVLLSYSRIPDRQVLTPAGTATAASVTTGQAYTAVTQNLGFGAYTPQFTMFMDGGTGSWAESPESVRACITQGADTVQRLDPDFILFQEVDTNSTRSYHINELTLLEQRLGSGWNHVAAVNYHSAFLLYPLYQPHGASNSDIVTFSRYAVTAAVRRSLPISTGLSKLLDLDRCYTVSRVPVENGRELVLYNVHLSAYGGSEAIRTAQMTMLFEDMAAEYAAGNYCVCGGDFNHDFTGTSTADLNGGESVEFGWAQPFPAELLPAGLHRCTAYTDPAVPTCRNCDVPYEPGNFTIIVDGFIVSDNVTVQAVENISTGFAYSDHNPVRLQFCLAE